MGATTTRHPHPHPPPPSLTESSFSTSGVTNQALVQNIYAGRFEDITLERDDMFFGFLYGKFLAVYGEKCKASLPANRVPIMKAICDHSVVTVNGWGVEVGSRCLHYTDVPTGVYADPEMYAAKLAVEKSIDANAIRQTMRLLSSAGKDPFAPAMNMLSATADMERDIDRLLELNACGSPGMKRFQENLKRYALGKQSIPLNANSKARATPPSNVRDSDHQALVEDLISDFAMSWAVNHYVGGSVNDVQVTARDADGRPLTIAARYRYKGFNGLSDGSVRIAFADGLPECMYFFDSPSTCKTPNRKIVAAYRDGRYPRETAEVRPEPLPPSPPPPTPLEPAVKSDAGEPPVEAASPDEGGDFGDIGPHDDLRVRNKVRLDVEPSDATVMIRGVGEQFRDRGIAAKYAESRRLIIDSEPQLLLLRRAGYRDRLIVLTLDADEGEEVIRVRLFEDDTP
jgi:hypothetical protein